jgi:hypothetical protein
VFVNNQLRYKLDSAYCASVREDKFDDGADVILWHCGKTSVGQQWEIDGSRIRSKLNRNKCMSVREGKAGDGSDVILWECGNSNEFKWRVENEHVKFEVDPRYWLSVRKNDIQDGSDLILWSGHAAGYEFLFDSSSPHIKLKAKPSLCVSVREGHKNMDSGKDLILWSCGPSDARGQSWEYVQGALRSKTDPNKCLGVREGIYKDGADIINWECGSNPPQWLISGERIRATASADYCMRVEQDRAGEGSRIKLWHCDLADEEDKEGFDLHYEKYNGIEHQVGGFQIGTDGAIRSNLDPRYCASVSQGEIMDGPKIIMWHCGMSGSGTVGHEQQWKLENSLIKLEKHPNYCMSVREGKAGAGSDIILWSCGQTKEFRWDVDGSAIKFRADSHFHLHVRENSIFDGQELILWDGFASPFRWQIENEHIKLKVDPRLCLSVREGKIGDGSNVILWTCGGSDEYQWVVAGDHIMPSTDQSKCLSVREGRTQDGMDIIIWSCHDNDPSQKWVVMGDRIRLKDHSIRDYCLSVRAGRAGEGSDILLWSCDERLNLDDEL